MPINWSNRSRDYFFRLSLGLWFCRINIGQIFAEKLLSYRWRDCRMGQYNYISWKLHIHSWGHKRFFSFCFLICLHLWQIKSEGEWVLMKVRGRGHVPQVLRRPSAQAAWAQCSRIRIFRFFQISKNMTFYVFFEWLTTFSRTLHEPASHTRSNNRQGCLSR